MEKEYNTYDDIYDLNIVDVKPLDNYDLIITYSNNEVISYNMEHLFKNKLEVLKDINLFKKVFIDEFGNISWNIDDNIDSNDNWDNRIDVSKETVYFEGIRIK